MAEIDIESRPQEAPTAELEANKRPETDDAQLGKLRDAEAVAQEHPASHTTYVDHPLSKSHPVPPSANVTGAARRFLKPRPAVQARIVICDKKPLYYFDGVTGYDCVQHRPSSGMYGGRVFSLQGQDDSRPTSAAPTTMEEGGSRKPHTNVFREGTRSSLASYTSSSLGPSRSVLSDASNINIIFGDDHLVRHFPVQSTWNPV